MRKTIAILMTATLLLVAAGAALAEDEKDKKDDKGREGREGDHHGKPEFKPAKQGYLFHNDQIAVYFKANKNKAAPDLRVVFNGSADDEKSGYRVKLLRLYETDGNSTEFEGKSPSINLARADDWNVKTEEGNGTLTLTMVRAEAQGIVTLVWHIDTNKSSVKFDVGVENWRWADANDKLILDMLVQGKNLKNETGAKISVEDAGYITWADNATATYGNATQTIPVQAYRGEVKSDDKDEKEKDDDKGGHLYLVFNGTGGYSSLQYDPELGVQSSSASVQTVPGFAPVLAVLAIAGLALVVSRRRS